MMNFDALSEVIDALLMDLGDRTDNPEYQKGLDRAERVFDYIFEERWALGDEQEACQKALDVLVYLVLLWKNLSYTK